MHKGVRKNAQNWSQFDVNASPHPFMSVSTNYKACLFGCFIIFSARARLVCVCVCVCDKWRAPEHCDLVQGLWMTWGMRRVTLYLASISSPPALPLHMVWFQFARCLCVCARACVCVPEQRVRHIPSAPKIPSFPPPLLPYFPNDSAGLVKTFVWLLSAL